MTQTQPLSTSDTRRAGDHPATSGRPLRVVVALALGATALLVCVRTAGILGGDVRDGTVWRSVDTRALVAGADAALDCAHEGTWRGCGTLPPGQQFPDYPDVPGSEVDRFPPLLYVPALLVQGAGGSQALSLRVIGTLSLVSFGVLVALPWLIGRRLRGLHRNRHLWAAVVLASPLLPYAGSTWSELPAAALLAVAVALVAADAPPALVALAALGAGLSKDTAPLFVIGLALAVARHQSQRRWLRSPALAGALAGSVAALGGTAAFNLFRFDTVRNITYLAPTFQVRRPGAVAGQAAALAASPNGGLFPFWPAAALLLVLAAAACRRGPRGIRIRFAAVGATVAAFLLSLAMWWSPFGWASWSPRLTLPLLPALAAAVLVLAPLRLPPRLPLLLAAAAAVVLAVPQAGITGNEAGIGAFMVSPRPACPPGALEEADVVRCNLDRAWRQHPGLLAAGLRGLRHPVGALLAVATAAAGVALVVRWGQESCAGDQLRGWDSNPEPNG